MQYQVDPADQTTENDQKPLFWLFGSFKNALFWFLNDPAWLGNVAKWLKTFSTITICNIKSSWCTKLKKTAKNQIEPQAPCLVVPFLIIFSFGTTQNVFCKHFHHHYLLDIKAAQLNTHYEPKKIAIAQENGLKPHFRPFSDTFSWIINEPAFFRKNRRVSFWPL